MNKKITHAVLTALFLAACIPTPGQARELSEIDNPIELTYRTLGAASGVTFGLPIATVRTIPTETGQYIESCAREFASSNDPDPMQYTVATVPGIAMGLTTGLFRGMARGLMTGAHRGFNNPFSLDSFSLGEDMEDAGF